MTSKEIEKQFNLINSKLERLKRDIRKIRTLVEEIHEMMKRLQAGLKEDPDYPGPGVTWSGPDSWSEGR